jgi:hypothetical protein
MDERDGWKVERRIKTKKIWGNKEKTTCIVVHVFM